MSNMHTKKCDICGALYVPEGKCGDGEIKILLGNELGKSYDVCTICMARVARIIEQRLDRFADKETLENTRDALRSSMSRLDEARATIKGLRRKLDELQARHEEVCHAAKETASVDAIKENEKLHKQIAAMQRDMVSLAKQCIECSMSGFKHRDTEV